MDKRFLILLAAVGLSGCMPHFKSVDSHDSMFSNVKPTGYGDPYTNGGIGEGSGGTKLMAPGDKQGPARAIVDPTTTLGGDLTVTPIYRGSTSTTREGASKPDDVEPSVRRDGGTVAPFTPSQP